MQALCLLFSKLQLYGRGFVKPKEASLQTLHWEQDGPQRERRKSLQAFIEHQNKLSDIQVQVLILNVHTPLPFQVYTITAC